MLARQTEASGKGLDPKRVIGDEASGPKRRDGFARAVLVLSLLIIGVQQVKGQFPESDPRNVDEVVLLDVSGSMVRDIRTALLKQALAQGETDNGRFRLARRVTIETALSDPRIQAVVTNNLLYKSILYAEAIIDQPGPRRIYFATFDDGPRILGTGKLPGESGKGFVGPFIVEQSDADPDSLARGRIKSLLAPERHGPYAGAPQWHGVLAEAVLNGSRLTAIHGTCLAGLHFLEDRILPGYTNSTRLQRMTLFTDGVEEKAPTIPFTKTIESFKLHRSGMAFEFDKYFILRGNETLPPEIVAESSALANAGFGEIKTIEPRPLQVSSESDGTFLFGQLAEPEDSVASVSITLSPSIKFKVYARNSEPVRGKLRFSIVCQGATATVEPAEVATDALDQPVRFSMAVKGNEWKGLCRSGLKKFDKLSLVWDFLPASQNLREDKMGEAFYGNRSWPISLQIVPLGEAVALHCIEPTGQDLSTGKRLELSAAPHSGALAVLQADFSQIRNDGSLLVELKPTIQSSWVKLNPGSGTSVTLARNASGSSKPEFSLKAEAPPGADRVDLTLRVMSQSQWLTPTPSNIEVAVAFEPSVIETTWFTHDDQPAAPPKTIDLGTVDMEPTLDPDGEVRSAHPPGVDTVKLSIPDLAVTPAAKWVLSGEHPEAFTVISLGDGGGSELNAINHTVKLRVRGKHFFVKSERLVTTNVTAVLEIQPVANFVFTPQEGATAAQRQSKIVVPLQMTAVIPPQENLKPSPSN